jgi:hypothetical protein
MTESHPDEKKDPTTSKVVLKSVRIKRPTRVIRSSRAKPIVNHDTIDTKQTSSESSQSSISPLWKGATQSSQSSVSWIDRIFQPNLQYKLFLLFLSIWGASFIMFYLSTSFAIILPEPFNLVVLGFFLVSTSLSGIYTFLLGIQHLRNTRQNSDDSYY